MTINNDAGKHLFSFAVIADTHLNQSETECNSPFEVNRLANERFSHVVDLLNKHDVAFVVHLGDVVHPVPSMGPLYSDSAARFHEQIDRLKHPLHLIPGNHDVGDKPILWGPAGTVRESFLDAWSEHFGDHFFSFVHENAAFVGINAQVIGSGLALEQQQRAWLEQTLKQFSGKRIFLFSHYPPYLHDVDEREHYDNLGAQGRQWMLQLLSMHKVEALFAGHVHNFWYNRYQETDCYLLPSTAFVRQDYSELFRVAPGPEFGRNDAPKLGFVIVHVSTVGHTFNVVRSQPEMPASLFVDSADDVQTIAPVNPQSNRTPVLGFDLRHDWAETVQIPPSGGLDEFDRKSVRNDYGLLALWDTGVRHLRIPLADLVDTTRRQRIVDLHRLGFAFTLYSFGIPSKEDVAFIKSVAQSISAWEIAWPLHQFDALSDAQDSSTLLQLLAKECDVALYLSPLRSKDDILKAGGKYYHVINHGFTQGDQLNDPIYADNHDALDVVDGVVYRLGLYDSVWQATQHAQALGAAQQKPKQNLKQMMVHLRTAPDGLGQGKADEAYINARLAQAMICAWGTPNLSVYTDSLTDNDRGYFQRLGIVDRLFNPKSTYYVVKFLHAMLSQVNETPIRLTHASNTNGEWIRAHLKNRQILLLAGNISDQEYAGYHLADLLQQSRESESNPIQSSRFAVLDWRSGNLREYKTEQALVSALPILCFEPLVFVET